MPAPIKPNSSNFEMSFFPTISLESIGLESLRNDSYQNSSIDTDVDILMNLWNNGKRLEGHKYAIPTGFSKTQLMRLKSNGLISLNGENVEFTTKASNVIKTMVLAEQNSFYQKRQKKPYSVILAESKRPIRKSNLTHTAQVGNRAPRPDSVYISSRRLALIDQTRGNDNFKEYSIRIYIGDDGNYEVWGYAGRIGGTQTGWLKGSFRTLPEAEMAARKVEDIQLSKGYESGSSYGQVRSNNDRRDGLRLFDLRNENSSIPGTFDRNARSTGRTAPRVVAPSSRPSSPTTPVNKPISPPVTPTKHVEDRSLPTGYKIEGPTRIGIDNNTGKPLTGYFVADPNGKPIENGIGDTPVEAMERARPMLTLIKEELRLPEGYTIAGPPRDKNTRNVFIVRDPTGLPVGTDVSSHEAVSKALEWAAEHPTPEGFIKKTKPVEEKEDPILVENKKKAGELSELLPQGYKFQMGLKNFDLNSWYVINEKEEVVSGTVGKDHMFASGKTPQIAFDNFEKIRKHSVHKIKNDFLDLMRNRFKGANTKNTFNRYSDSKKKDKSRIDFLDLAENIISEITRKLSEYGFESFPFISRDGIGWASCSFFLKGIDEGLKIIVEPSLITVLSISKSGNKPEVMVYKSSLNRDLNDLINMIISLFKNENKDAVIRRIPEHIRKLRDSFLQGIK